MDEIIRNNIRGCFTIITQEASDFNIQLKSFSEEGLYNHLNKSVHVENYHRFLLENEGCKISKTDYINELEKLLSPPPPPKSIKKIELEPWLDSKWRKSSKIRWNNYVQMLIDQGKGDMIANLEGETFEILDSCHNPENNNTMWDRRGLVYGHVQSGKTANYVGLINKAYDVGYQIVIVLTGMTEDLRKQTQDRIDAGVIGRKSNGELYGVGKQAQYINDVIPATDIHIDLSTTNANASINYTQKSIWVIKKNKAVLESLIKWLDSQRTTQGYEKIQGIPFLIIDDEADNASIQSLSKKEFEIYTQGQEVAGIEEDDLTKEEEIKLEKAKARIIKAINRNIRAALSLIGQKTFVAYTATPYSVINQTERDVEHEIKIKHKTYTIDENTDLFPEDFIIPIQPGKKYMGIDKVFPDNAHKKIRITTDITSSDYKDDLTRDNDDALSYYFPRKRGENYVFNELPISLKEAIIHFLVTIFVRKSRNFHDYNSMLVHTSHLTKNADYLAARINEFLEKLRTNLIIGNLELMPIFKKRLELINKNSDDYKFKEYFGVNNYQTPNEITRKDVIDILNDVESPLDVVSYHSSNAPELEHHNHTLRFDLTIPRNYIVVGGNRLSRGLTLEGLTTSYFVRSSTRQDSLYQMARWFGYRIRYEDVVQIFMPQDRIDWFEDVFKLEKSLRDDLNDMNDSGIMPRDWVIKLANHKSLASINNKISVCDPNKLRNTSERELSFSGNIVTKKIKRDNNLQLSNYRTIRNFFSKISVKPGVSLFNNAFLPDEIKNNNINFENVSYIDIIGLLNNYSLHQDDQINFDSLTDYIDKNSSELSSWSVVLAQKPGKPIEIKDDWEMKSYNTKNELVIKKIIALERTPMKKSNNETLYFESFIDRDKDNTFDIIDESNISEYIKESNKARYRLRTRNDNKKPILIVYLTKGKIEKSEIVFPLLYITLPNIKNGTKVKYIVRNR